MINLGNLGKPITRIEQYLSAISGNSTEVPRPITRVEQYLAAILESGGGGGGGGTTDYENLTSKPSINGVELSGNLKLSAIMADITSEEVEQALPESDIESIVDEAWNAEFNGGGG